MGNDAIPQTMSAARFPGRGKIKFTRKPVPEPGTGQLLVKVKANALCGSEREQLSDGVPVTPGHEVAGIVVAAGPETRTPTGTPGVVYAIDFCGRCRSCKLGFTNECLDSDGVIGYTKDGGYASYVLINERVFFPIDADIPLTEATLLLDTMGTSAHAIKLAQRSRPDIESLLVAGAGPIGLGVLVMAKRILGADLPVVISDFSPYRLEMAALMGGVPVNLNETDLAGGLRRHGFINVDLAIDTAGKRAAREACFGVLSRRGILVCVGAGEHLTVEVLPDLIDPERTIIGSQYFCFHELYEYQRQLREKSEHSDRLRRIITHRFSLNQLERAFDVFFSGEAGKVVIEQ